MSKDTLLEQIKTNKSLLTKESDEENELEVIKEVVCPFYSGHPKCRTCVQPEEKLLECKDKYLEGIDATPQEKWSSGFGAIKPIERKPDKEKHMFSMLCDRCYFMEVCPHYEESSTCSVNFKSDVSNEPKDLIDSLLDLQKERINRARSAELVDGGMPDQNLSGEMDRLTALINMKQELNSFKFKMSVEGSGHGEGGGILSKLFGKQDEPKSLEEKDNTIDIPYTEEKAEEKVKVSRKSRRKKDERRKK